MFERSKSGQQNRAAFLDADYTCYVEGGGGGDRNSPDVTFWRQVLSVFMPGRRVRFVPRGGKPILQALALDAIDKNLSNTLIAMDSDYDVPRRKVIDDARVFYSAGYSWENCAFHPDNLSSVFGAITHSNDVAEEVAEFIDEAVSRALQALRRAVVADYYLLCGGASLLPRQSPGRIIAQGADGLPSIRKGEVLKLCGQANKDTRPRAAVPPLPTGRDALQCVGHVFAHLATLVLRAAVRRFHGNQVPSPDHVRDVAIQVLPSYLAGNGLASMHYGSQVARL